MQIKIKNKERKEERKDRKREKTNNIIILSIKNNNIKPL